MPRQRPSLNLKSRRRARLALGPGRDRVAGATRTNRPARPGLRLGGGSESDDWDGAGGSEAGPRRPARLGGRQAHGVDSGGAAAASDPGAARTGCSPPRPRTPSRALPPPHLRAPQGCRAVPPRTGRRLGRMGPRVPLCRRAPRPLTAGRGGGGGRPVPELQVGHGPPAARHRLPALRAVEPRPPPLRAGPRAESAIWAPGRRRAPPTRLDRPAFRMPPGLISGTMRRHPARANTGPAPAASRPRWLRGDRGPGPQAASLGAVPACWNQGGGNAMRWL